MLGNGAVGDLLGPASSHSPGVHSPAWVTGFALELPWGAHGEPASLGQPAGRAGTVAVGICLPGVFSQKVENLFFRSAVRVPAVRAHQLHLPDGGCLLGFGHADQRAGGGDQVLRLPPGAERAGLLPQFQEHHEDRVLLHRLLQQHHPPPARR